MTRNAGDLRVLAAVLLACAALGPLSCADGGGGDAGAKDDGGTDDGDGGGLACEGAVEVTAPGDGYVYLGARYTGLTTPGPLALEPGAHRIGVGVVGGAYYAREVELTADTCEVALGEQDRLEPRVWRALWIGIAEAQAMVDDALCQTQASAADLDAAYDFFVDSMRDDMEGYAHQAVAWEIVREDTTMPVSVSGGEDWYDVQPADLYEITYDMTPGQYDAIFAFWKSQGDGCAIPGGYLGLGWSPQPATWWSGFVTVKFETDDIPGQVTYHQQNDPGLWIHEWLHTICEGFYQGLGGELPAPDQSGLVVHGAEEHGYSFPWMEWYEDLIGARVAEDGAFRGLGPEVLAACTVREVAASPDECQLPLD